MRKLYVLQAILIIIFLAGCKKNDSADSNAKDVYTIAVLADNHYMDPSLLINDRPAFQDYLVTNGKLLAASDAILQERSGPGTMTWILNRLAEAAQKGKTVFGMMHHGIVEQFTGKHSSFPGFMLDNDTDVSAQLMIPH